jgi:hypothetical protein
MAILSVKIGALGQIVPFGNAHLAKHCILRQLPYSAKSGSYRFSISKFRKKRRHSTCAA